MLNVCTTSNKVLHAIIINAYHVSQSSLLVSTFEGRLAHTLGHSEAKVDDLGMVAFSEHDIVGLKVSVPYNLFFSVFS